MSSSTSLQRYEGAIARRGHSDNRVVQASFKDLIPLRQRSDVGEISLERPSDEEVAATKERTANALAALVSGAVSAQKPKNVRGASRAEPTYVRYTPAQQMGDASARQDRIIKIVDRQQDPMEPPKFRHKKIPRGPPSPPPPVMHSPPRKLTAEDQEAWRIPPPISNWKNPKGYTVPLDKRLAADGRGAQDVTINDKFAQFTEALQEADKQAREEVQQRRLMQQRLAEKEKAQKEDHLRMLAQRAREERMAAVGGAGGGGRRRRSESFDEDESRGSRRRSYDDDDQSASDDSEAAEEAREREEMRRERRREHERELRQSRMGTERRMQMLAREQNRDISEKVALGMAKPTRSAETMYDSRLFNRSSGFDVGYNEDQVYDKPLFGAQNAINSIYRPTVGGNDEEAEDGGETFDRIQKSNRFEVLGKAKEGFKGAAEQDQREGPVQFEKDTDDPFGINEMISDATGGAAGKKRYGMEEPEAVRSSKRAKVEDDED
ncbi:SKIP/SNW domain-containing protein [Lineolata rhizophorae]|uniref:Pre-mRNA-processing protein 45 n=1 Tax=Lineolata rhizophorae TaxID=578093 RepID=A0A6A6NW18_9PEZI|nr:SKIP/SNW domain-containing protein [Lineolata rhizophorae]